jgi:hypothetical protein
MELIKLYKSRFKYTGENAWAKVVHSTIKRRVGDFRVVMLRHDDRIITENRLAETEDEKHNEFYDRTVEPQRLDDCVWLRRHIADTIGKAPFTLWDREAYEVICEMHKRKERIDDGEIAYYMGYDKEDMKEFRVLIEEFRKRLKESEAGTL